MGRDRDYKKEKTEEEYVSEVEKLAYKGVLTPKQMAAYLSKYSRKHIHFDEKKVKGRIEEICALSDGLMCVDDFKAKTGRKPYQFKPEWHGLLFALMDTEYFDNRKNNRLLSTRESLYRDLVVNIEFYLHGKDQEVVKSYLGYLNAKCEGIASEAINYQIQNLIRDAMHSDETVRLRLLRRIHDVLNELIEQNRKEISRMWSSKLVYKHTFDDAEDGKFLSSLLYAEKLPTFMAELLALKVNGVTYDELADADKLLYKNIYEASQIDEPIPLPDKEDFSAFVKNINNKAEHDNHFENLIVRLYSVMDMEDPMEKQLFIDFWNVARARFISGKITEEELSKSKKFFESAMQVDMFDLLNEFVNGDWNSPVITELQRITSQEALIKNQLEKEQRKENPEN